MIKLLEAKKIYFIGIGGIGMSAVAGIAKAKGYHVFGSDAADIYDPSKKVLDHFDIKYKIGFAESNLLTAFDPAPDLVVITAAVGADNVELKKALQLKLRIISYPELLGALSLDKQRIVVVGTHGKGSTAGLIAWTLKNLEDSSFFVGVVLNNLKTNFYYGSGPNFVLEGDEYRSSYSDLTPKFQYYKPDVLVLNNLEFDHPDLYKDLEAVKSVFRQLLASMDDGTVLIFNADDKNVVELAESFKFQKVGFGFGAGNVRGRNLQKRRNNFEIHIDNLTKNENFKVQTVFPGTLYAYNILAAVTTLMTLGFSEHQIEANVKSYSGIKRRYEIISDSTYTIIDDYAHHPTAVRETLAATRLKYPDRRLVCFFEPHTYSRTKETLEELVNSFEPADLVFLAEVYPAREQKLPSSISGQQVAEAISKKHSHVDYVSDKEDALEKYLKIAKPGDVIVVMAVGSFNSLVLDLKTKLL